MMCKKQVQHTLNAYILQQYDIHNSWHPIENQQIYKDAKEYHQSPREKQIKDLEMYCTARWL